MIKLEDQVKHLKNENLELTEKNDDILSQLNDKKREWIE